MSPRPRKVSDEDIFAAAQRAMTKHGPHQLTLAHIAEEAGVTAGLLVQRFGGKRELLVAISERFGGGASALFQQLRSSRSSPLGVMRAYAECVAGLAESPEALARNLAYLQIDLTDTDLRRNLVKHAQGARAELEKLIREGMRAGEIKPRTKARRLARTIETTISGSLMTWATYQEGKASRWMRADVDAVIEPHLV